MTETLDRARTHVEPAPGPLPTGIRTASPATRFIFRGGDAAVRRAEAAFGVPFPRQACRSASAGARHVLWLGPDEWLLLARESEREAIEAAIAGALQDEPHALVDIGQRNVGIEIEGALATEILAVGCPLDLDGAACPLGFCARTLFGKAEIVLWRTGATGFRIEVWRSFAPYVDTLLRLTAREHDAGR